MSDDKTTTATERAARKARTGVVVSDKMDKTVTVMVERMVKHRLYRKYIRRRNKFTAHDERNGCRVGDKVLITESRPLSRNKRWRVSQIIQKAV